MSSLFLVSFIAGLVLGVRTMLYGVERGTVSPFAIPPDELGRVALPPPRVRHWVPLLGAFLAAFGLVGYIALRRSGFTGPSLGIAIVAGSILAAVASRLVRRAVAFVPEHDPDDPRYVLQGHVARVTAPIGDGEGEIAYAVEGASHRARARAIDGGRVEAGTEVVIERIEDGVAYVEPWTEVEQRL